MTGSRWPGVSSIGQLAIALMLSVLTGCSAIEGYAHDPEDVDATLTALAPYFAANSEDTYNRTTDPAARQHIRDDIVLHRIRAYDLEFDAFERSLFGSGNSAAIGSDLAVLILNGLGATTGASATKSALAAASAGIVGAQGAINKDLYYQKTLPAILAQMDANRTKAKLTILTGLSLDDTHYSLLRADIDLEALKRAGGIPSAIMTITQQAGNDAKRAQAEIDAVRSAVLSTSSTTARLTAWLYPDGKKIADDGKPNDPIPANLQALTEWMEKDEVDPSLRQTPWEMLVDGADSAGRLEQDRVRFLNEKKIP